MKPKNKRNIMLPRISTTLMHICTNAALFAAYQSL